MKSNYEICVEGRVQGVGYRYFARIKASELNLTGYTRNSPEGNVIVVAEGEKEDLDTLVDYLWLGPPLARVRHITVSRLPYSGNLEDFHIQF
jgi:acylphosphatase